MEKKAKSRSRKKTGSSDSGRCFTTSSNSSNLADELFGPKDSPSSPSSSSSGLFATLFPHPSANREGRKGSWEQHGSGNATYQQAEGGEQNVASESSRYFSSSIYYGGRETYSPTTQSPAPPPPQYTSVDGEEDDQADDGMASRGNWWKGSLHY